MKYNFNTLAKDISKLEGKKQPLSIAQIKEVLKCLVKLYVESRDVEFLFRDLIKAEANRVYKNILKSSRK